MRGTLWVSLGLLAAAAPTSCHRSSLSRIEALRDALAAGDRERAIAVVDVAPCPEPHEGALTRCLDATARAFGATAGFSAERPDQASAATVAYLLVRHREGVGIPRPDTWLEAVASAPGRGADALRLAVAGAMADDAPVVGRHAEDESAARSMLAAVARSIPGACGTYARLGRGADVAGLLPAQSPDHSPCVQHDLERKDGPGPAYGDGLWRAAAGGAALWKDAARALTIGSGTTGGPTRSAIQKRLAVIDVATRELVVRVVTTSQSGGYGAAMDPHRAADVTPAGTPRPTQGTDDVGARPPSP